MYFSLHTNLEKKEFIIDLPLCKVLFEDNAYYRWIFLVPKRENISRIMELSFDDQIQLIKELDVAQKIMWDLFKPTQLNVAAIGNKTPQLHIHVISRFENDPAWPGTVWDNPNTKPYDQNTKIKLISEIKNSFNERLKI